MLKSALVVKATTVVLWFLQAYLQERASGVFTIGGQF